MRRFQQSLLWLGNIRDARNFQALFDVGIQAVVGLALEEQVEYLPHEFVYCRFPLLDGLGNPSWLLRAAVDTTANLIQLCVPTLVSCNMGVSRSPCIAAAALAVAREGNPDEYLAAVVRDGPGDVAPALWKEVIQAVQDLQQTKAAVKSADQSREN
jgi:protein-tyrosine phosphatase